MSLVKVGSSTKAVVKDISGRKLGQSKLLGWETCYLSALVSRLTAVLKVSSLWAIAKRELKGDDVRNVLGLRSTRFTIAADPLGVRLAGRGWGHGLGMSQ